MPWNLGFVFVKIVCLEPCGNSTMCVLVEVVGFYKFQKNSKSVLLQACKIFYFFWQENHRASCSRRVSFVVIILIE